MATMTTAVMRAATVVAAAVRTIVMLVIVVVALDIRIIAEIVRKIRLDRCIARTADTSIELDTRIGKCHLRTASDAAADQNRHTLLRKESRKCSVTASVRVNDL